MSRGLVLLEVSNLKHSTPAFPDAAAGVGANPHGVGWPGQLFRIIGASIRPLAAI